METEPETDPSVGSESRSEPNARKRPQRSDARDSRARLLFSGLRELKRLFLDGALLPECWPERVEELDAN